MVQFIVTNLEDSGAGSLRQAIEDANAQPGKDEIVFEDSLSGGRIDFTNDEFENVIISDSVSIQGLGAEQLAISSNEEAIFLISDGTENVIEVEIDGLSLVENGTRYLGRFGYYGAAIINRENLTVTNSVIRDGDVGSDGIIVSGYDNLAELTLVDSTISGFVTGIDSKAENITVIGSTFFDNSNRGIVSNVDSRGLPFINSNDSIGTVDIRQSTISGNAGGISINGDSVTTVNITNTTISDNDGSGINLRNSYDNNTSPEFTITSSIIAGNKVNEFNSAETVDLAGEGVFTSGGNNLIGVGGNTSFVDGVNGDLVGTAENPTNPGLTPLQDNGGKTPTQALLSNSPAIDAGSNPLNLEFDQRGEGFERVVNSGADIGAFELQNSDTLVSIVATTSVAAEGENNGVFTISRSGQTAGELVVNLVIDEETTVNLDDYNLVGDNFSVAGDRVTLTIPDGESSTDLIFEPIDDALAEAEENFILRITASQEYDIDGNNPLATVTIDRSDLNTDTVVTNTNDNGVGSLREALANANLLEGTQNITFAPSLQGETITLTSGELTITDSVDIEGIENRGITISGNNSSRVLNINDGNDSDRRIDVKISDVVITEGKTDDIGNVYYSREPITGGIFNSENLTITNSAISGNTGNGVTIEEGSLNIEESDIENNSDTGIRNRSGNPEIRNSNITGNRTGIDNDNSYSYDYGATVVVEQSTISGNADGIRNYSTAIINNSTIVSNTPNDSNPYAGTGIFNRGSITIDNSTIADNLGGGISNYSSNPDSMTINNSTITGNQDGGITNLGNLEINKTTISENFADFGGGIDNDSGSVIINDSIISNNSATYGGGGIENSDRSNLEVVSSVITNNVSVGNTRNEGYGGGIDNSGSATIVNSTISGNSASGSGGGINNNPFYSNYYETGLTIANSTITGNSASEGSGIYNGVYTNNYYGETYTSNATITSTIIAGNESDRDVAGESEFTSNGNNLIGNGDGASGFSDGVNGDIIGTTANAIDPLLGTLQDNGGATPTVALLTGSPAIDAGSNPLNLTTDQRGSGFPRTVDGDGDGVAAVDIGAFEADAGDNPNPPNPPSGGGNDGELIIGTNGKDTIRGGAGNDTIDGGDGSDTLFGGAGNDELFGNSGNDSLVGNQGSDTLNGGNGSDNLNGSEGNDELFGDSGRDFLVGNSGNDFIDGGNGSDTLVGGLGEDRFVIAVQNGADNIIDYIDGTDSFVLADGLSFEQLSIVERNNSTEIRLADNNQLLTKVSLVSAEVISESDFING